MAKSNRVIVGDRTVRNFEFLYRVARSKSPKARWNMIRHATRDQLHSLIDICAAIVFKDFQLKDHQNERIKPFWEFVQKIGRVKRPEKALEYIQKGEGSVIRKRKRGTAIETYQVGGLLPAIIAPIIAEIAAMGVDKILEHYGI